MSQSIKRSAFESDPVKFIQDFFTTKMLSPEIGITVAVAPVRFAEQAYFSLKLTKDGTASLDPVFSGLFSAGRPSQAIAGWVDGDFFDSTNFPDGNYASLTEVGLDFLLFKMLGELVPSGGTLMVSYSLYSKESGIHKETKLGLDRGYPPAVTPLGFLLFVAGCGMGFKDWYFAEGGREGPEKLQGFKPKDSDVAQKRAKLMLEELHTFINRPQTDEDNLTRVCRFRARIVVRELEKMKS